MRKFLALSYILCIFGFACLAHAQLSQTGAGPKAGGGGGGGYTPCGGTAVHMASPNDLSSVANWGNSLITATFNATDPNGVANNATDLKSTSGGGSFNVNMMGIGATNVFTLTAVTGTYQFGAQFKSIVAPSWIRFFVFDGSANFFGSWFNLSPAAVGNSLGNVGTGVLDCSAAGASTNGYSQISIGGHVTSNTSGMFIRIDLVDGNGTGVTTVNQEINAWAVSP